MKKLSKLLSMLLLVSMVLAVFPTSVFAKEPSDIIGKEYFRTMVASTDQTKLKQEYSWNASGIWDVVIGETITKWSYRKATFNFEVDEAILKKMVGNSAKIEIEVLGSNRGDHRVKLNGTKIGNLPNTGYNTTGTKTYNVGSLKTGKNSIRIETPHTDVHGLSVMAVKVSFDLKPITHTVTFNSNGGSIVNKIENIKDNATIAQPSPTKADYDFDGWYKEDGITLWNFATDKVSSNITLYAKWSASNRTYGVYQYSPNAAVGSYDTQFEGEIYSNLTITKDKIESYVNTEKYGKYEGYELHGLRPNGTGFELIASKDSPADSPTAIKDIYDVSEFKGLRIHLSYESTYTVTFDSNGGSAVNKIKNIEDNVKIEAPTPTTKAEYDFVGWYKDIEYKTLWNFDTDKVSSNITLYAKWSVSNRIYGAYHYSPNAIGPFGYDTEFEGQLFSDTVITDAYINNLKNESKYGNYEGYILWGYKPGEPAEIISTKDDTTTHKDKYDISEFKALRIHLSYQSIPVNYNVNFYKENESTPFKTSIKNGRVGGSGEVTQNEIDTVLATLSGYQVDLSKPALNITLTATDNNNIINVYYVKDDAAKQQYWVKYFINGNLVERLNYTSFAHKSNLIIESVRDANYAEGNYKTDLSNCVLDDSHDNIFPFTVKTGENANESLNTINVYYKTIEGDIIKVKHQYFLNGALQTSLTTNNNQEAPADKANILTSVWQKLNGYSFSGITIKGTLKELFSKPIADVQAQINELNDQLKDLQDQLKEVTSSVPENKEVTSAVPENKEVTSSVPENKEVTSAVPENKEVTSSAPTPKLLSLVVAPAKSLSEIEKEINDLKLAIAELQALLGKNEITLTDTTFVYDARYNYSVTINYSKTVSTGGGSTGGGNTGNTNTDGNVYIPEVEVPLAKLPEDIITIVDETVPLGKLPKSGGIQAASVGGSAILALALSVLLKFNKKEE